MRLFALIPIALCTAALILTFLCMFAGSKRGFMENYAIVTLNASRFGEDIFNTSKTSSNPLISILDNITDTIEGDIESDINTIAKDLGLHDFYSAHLLDFCEGWYEPGPVPNATLSKSQIHKNVTACSNTTALFSFNAEKILQEELNKTTLGRSINLAAVAWPAELDDALRALGATWKATFVMYCIALVSIFLAIAQSVLCIFFTGRLSACMNVLSDWGAFLSTGIASATATIIAVKSAHLLNKYGGDSGLTATRGDSFLALTWAATALLFVSSLLWCFDCIKGTRNRRRAPKKESY